MIKMKKSSLASVLIIAGSSFFSNSLVAGTAVSRPSVFPYYTECWISVDIKDFSMVKEISVDLPKNIADAQMAYNIGNKAESAVPGKPNVPLAIEGYNKAVSEQMVEYSKNLVQATYESAEFRKAALMEVKKELLYAEMNYLAEVKNQSIAYNNSESFADANGVNGVVSTEKPSYQFYKDMCKRNKIAKKIAGSESRIETSKSVASGMNQRQLEAVSTYSSKVATRSNQVNHFENYCSQDDADIGLCEEPSELPHGDISSQVFLEPMGQAEANLNPDDMYITSMTYGEDELQAAEDYIRNVINYGYIEAPTASDKLNPQKQDYVKAYESDMALLSLAEISLETAKELRRPITEGEIKMGKLELLNYTVNQYSDAESLISVSNSKARGKEIVMYNLMTLRNKLEYEKLRRLERIKLLTAGNLAKSENSYTVYKQFQSVKE